MSNKINKNAKKKYSKNIKNAIKSISFDDVRKLDSHKKISKKEMVLSIIAILFLSISTLSLSYGVFTYTKLGTTENTATTGTLKFLYTENTGVGAGINLTNAFPVSDEAGMNYTSDGKVFDFTIEATNTSLAAMPYEITLAKKNTSTLDENVVKVYFTDITDDADTAILSPALYNELPETTINNNSESEKTLYVGQVPKGTETYVKNYRLRMWVTEGTNYSGIEQEDGSMVYPYNEKSFIATVNVYADSDYSYKEEILNGADPVLEDSLVPVVIDESGKVTKANTRTEWYDYETKKWANAVILKDESITYKNGDSIPESNIESYFVWIPKYSYQIFDLGNYTGLTSIASKEQIINIKFGLSNTGDSRVGECTTPMNDDRTQALAGESGSCQIGDYMTHPAFLSFDSNGFWVGKFETGYDGATSTAGAQSDTVNTSKIVIKPNVYSWRNITVGNIFKNGYDYNRSLDSHSMKNTEWGAVAYLQHSLYGSATSVRFNNNKVFITGYAATEEPTKGYNGGISIDGNRNESTGLGVDGTYTVNYLNSASTVASTTGNYTGIYDMSGGSWEYVMGYTTGATTIGGSSGITSLYSNFFTDSIYTKYWDKYSSTTTTNYNNRILGDATGEMGSFGSQTDPDGTARYKSSWYGDYAYFAYSTNPWFARGGDWAGGTDVGAFASSSFTGAVYTNYGFRIVLTP